MSEYFPEPSADEVESMVQGMELYTAHHALIHDISTSTDLDEGLDKIYLEATRNNMGLDEI